MTQQDILNYFLQGAGIEPDTEDGIAVGHLTPHFATAGVDMVMEKYTTYIDSLIQKLPEGSIARLELFIRRGFKFSEYQTLFDMTIRESSFASYVIFRCLWITTERERRRYALAFLKDSHEDYIAVLSKTLAPFAPWLVNFFFGVRCYSKSFRKKSFTSTRSYSRKVGGWEIKIVRDYVL
jgi:hypothetical protein